VGVGVMSDRRVLPTEQPNNASTSKAPKAANSKTRFLIKQGSSENR
jgi:hypothetical protein